MKRTNRIFTLLIATALIIGALAFGTVTAFAASGDVTDARFVPKGIDGAAQDILSWSPVEGAASYGITLHLASDGTEVTRTSTTTNSIAAADLLQGKEGTFYFTVAALNETGFIPLGQGATSASFTYPVRVQVGQVKLADGEYTKDGTSKSTSMPAGMRYAHYKDGVLTLNNFKYAGDGDNNAVIYATEYIKLRLLGGNEITPTVNSAILAKKTLDIYGSGTLTIDHPVASASTIWVFADTSINDVELYIQSDGDGLRAGRLTVKNTTMNIGAENYGMRCDTVEITDSALHLTAYNGSCIFAAGGDIEIENSTVEAAGEVCLNANWTHNIRFISGTLKLTGTNTEYGAIYTQESRLILPTVDYWWRTSTDDAASAFIKSTEQAFTYSYQGYIEIATTQPHEYYYTLAGSKFIEECHTCYHYATAEIQENFRETYYTGEAFRLQIAYSENWAGGRPAECTYDSGVVSECINVGTYTAEITFGDVTFEKIFTIEHAKLYIMAFDQQIVYGDAPSDNGVMYDGFVPGEDEHILNGKLTFTFDYKQYDPVGKYTITPGGYTAENYLIFYGNNTLTVVAATPTVSTPPTASAAPFGSPLSASALTGGEASVPGEFTWLDGTEVLTTAGTVQKTAVFTPEDNTNYETVELTVEVTVSDCDHSANTNPPSCANPVTCSVCGGTVEMLAHTYTVLKTSDTEHWYACSVCQTEQPDSRKAHSGGTATCTAKAECTVCGQEYGDMLAHEYRWIIDKEATETEDGIKHGECACGAVQNENTVIPKTGTEQPTEPKPSDNIFLQILLMILGLILSFAAVIIIL